MTQLPAARRASREQRRCLRRAIEEHGGTIPIESVNGSWWSMLRRMWEYGWVEPHGYTVLDAGRRAAGYRLCRACESWWPDIGSYREHYGSHYVETLGPAGLAMFAEAEADEMPPDVDRALLGKRVEWFVSGVPHAGRCMALDNASPGMAILVEDDGATVEVSRDALTILDEPEPLPSRVPAGVSAIGQAAAEAFGPRCVAHVEPGERDTVHRFIPGEGISDTTIATTPGLCRRREAASCHLTAEALHGRAAVVLHAYTATIAAAGDRIDAVMTDYARMHAEWWARIARAADADPLCSLLVREATYLAAEYWRLEADEQGTRQAKPPPPATPPASRPRAAEMHRPHTITQSLASYGRGPLGTYVRDNERTVSSAEILLFRNDSGPNRIPGQAEWGIPLDEWLAEGRTLSRYVARWLDEHEYRRNPNVVALVAPRGADDSALPWASFPIRWV